MGKVKISHSSDKQNSQTSVVNFSSLLASISPLLTMDENFEINYVNRSLENEFPKIKKFKGVSFYKVFPLSKVDKEAFINNIAHSKTARIGNCEFKIKERTFGYSIFRFANEIGIILKDISETKKLQKKIVSLHSKLLKLQENERQKIARNLHDSVGQTILAAKLNFSAFEKNPIQMRERFSAGLSLIDKASQELREIYTNLYPAALRELGLVSAIKSFLKDFADLKKYTISFSPKLKTTFSEEIQIHLFRITQEICTNIFKHANASKITLSLEEKKNWIELRISDNGRGFDIELNKMKPTSYGLENIRQRVEDMNGKIEIKSAMKKGTKFVIQIPVN